MTTKLGPYGNISYTPEPWSRTRLGARGQRLTWIPRVYHRDQVIPAEAPYAQIDRPWTVAELAAGGSGYGAFSEDYTAAPSAGAFGGVIPYGAAVTEVETYNPTEAAKIDAQSLIASLVPLAAETITSIQDPIRRAAVLEQKIKYAKLRGASSKRIALLQARLDAARREAGLRVEGEESRRTWRALGQTGVVVGIGVGLAFTFLLLRKALK